MEFVSGKQCSVIFLHGFSLFPLVNDRKRRITFPANVRFDNCTFLEAFYDQYAGQEKYALRIPLNEKTWTVHVAREKVQLLAPALGGSEEEIC